MSPVMPVKADSNFFWCRCFFKNPAQLRAGFLIYLCQSGWNHVKKAAIVCWCEA